MFFTINFDFKIPTVSSLVNSLPKIALMTTCKEATVVGALISDEHLSSLGVPLSLIIDSDSLPLSTECVSLSTESVDKDSPLSDEVEAAS